MDMKPYTVIGLWVDDIRHVAGVIPGHHQFADTGDYSYRFAVLVMAKDAKDAAKMAPEPKIGTYVSKIDGAHVVVIDTSVINGQHLRVFVNGGPIFDQSPEGAGPHGECGYVWREGSELHRCVLDSGHGGRRHACRCTRRFS